MAGGCPGPGFLGFPPVVGVAAGVVAAECERLKPFFDLAAVGGGELEGQQDRLARYAADATRARSLDALGQQVLGVADLAFDAVADPEVELLPFRAALLQSPATAWCWLPGSWPGPELARCPEDREVAEGEVGLGPGGSEGCAGQTSSWAP